MNAYELISPKTNKPCGVFVCGVCNLVTPRDIVDRCCKPCECGKPSRNRFECRCSDCAHKDRQERMDKALEKAELVEWDGSSMIFCDELSGHRDGWFDSPDDLLDYLADEELEDIPEFAFVGEKCVRMLDMVDVVGRLADDTYEDAEIHVSKEDWCEIKALEEKFNSKYAITYYGHSYRKKVRIRQEMPLEQ